jgi:hypothetical protein
LLGQTLQFKPPIDIATVARLAGYNLSRYGVATLAWALLGTTIPKGVVSVEDGIWYRRLGDIPEDLRLYACCDTHLVSACFYVLVACWVFQVMLEFGVVTRLSIAKHPRHLLAWWVTHLVDDVAASLGAAGPWEPAPTRLEAMRVVTAGSKHQPLMALLMPDWPAVTAGGCRYLHSARSWLRDRLMTFAALDSDFWPPHYTEEDLFITLGRSVAPWPSPRIPTSSFRLTYNPGCTDNVLSLSADQVNKENFTSLVGSYRPKRVILIEYALVYPAEAAKLLLRIEGSKKLASKLFCTDRKTCKLVGELCDTLSSALGALPRRPDDWVDPLPSQNPELRVQRTIAKAEEVAAVAQRRANQQSSCQQQLQQVVQTARSQPVDADSAMCFSRIVNPRRPGNPADCDRIYAAMGSRPDDCSRTASRARSGSCRHRSRSPLRRASDAKPSRVIDSRSDSRRARHPRYSSQSTRAIDASSGSGRATLSPSPVSVWAPSPWQITRTVQNSL